MTNNYFAIERHGKCISTEGIVLKDENNEIAFEDIMNMSYDEIIKNDEYIQQFIVGVMDATNAYFEEEDCETILTLIGEDDVFIWGIIMRPGDKDEIEYQFVDWEKGGKNFRYEFE